MKIRTAAKEDLDALLELEQGLIAHERPLDPTLKQTEKIFYYDLVALIASGDSEVLVAEIDRSIVGCGFGAIEKNKSKFIEKLYGYIGLVFVKEEFRRQGIAANIISNLFDWFEERGVREAMLRVYKNNVSAVKAYEKIGFQSGLVEMKMNLKHRD